MGCCFIYPFYVHQYVVIKYVTCADTYDTNPIYTRPNIDKLPAYSIYPPQTVFTLRQYLLRIQESLGRSASPNVGFIL